MRTIQSKLLASSLMIIAVILMIFGGLAYYGLTLHSASFLRINESRTEVTKNDLIGIFQKNISKIREIYESALENKGRGLIERDSVSITAMADDNAFQQIRDVIRKNFEKDPELILVSYFVEERGQLQAWQLVTERYKDGLELPILYDRKSSSWIAKDAKHGTVRVSDPSMPAITRLNAQSFALRQIELPDAQGNVRKRQVFDCVVPIYKGAYKGRLDLARKNGESIGYLRYMLSLEKMENTLREEEKGLNSYLNQLESSNAKMAEATKEITKSSLNSTFFVLGFAALLIFALAYALSWVSGRSLTGPIKRLTSVAQRMAAGDYDQKVEIESDDEVGVLTAAFGEMSRAITKRDVELAAINKDLEKRVSDRTAELRASNQAISAMVNSLGQGFLMFDRSKTCSSIYSRSCEDLLEACPSSKSILDVLKASESAREGLGDWCDLLFEEPLPFEDLAAIGQASFPHSKGKFVTLEYKPVRDEKNAISAIVVVATDKTEERQAKLAAKRQEAYASMVVKLMKNKDQFVGFLRDSRQLIALLAVESSKGDAAGVDVEAVLRHLHTLKGGAATFSISSLEEAAHKYESLLAPFGSATPQGKRELMPELRNCVAALREAITSFASDNKELLGSSWDGDERYREVPMARLTKFFSRISSVPGADALGQEFLDEFVAEPIQNFFNHFDTVIQPIAERLGKKIHPISFGGGDIRIVADPYTELFSSLVHAFRNSVDHGFERPEERERAGKGPIGTVRVGFSRRDVSGSQWLQIAIEDDGRGIDPEAIRSALRSRGRADLADSESDAAVIQHVFDSGLSTRDAVTDLSGRGIGMDAIKHAATKLGGRAEVRSTLGKGTSLTIMVPETRLLPREKASNRQLKAALGSLPDSWRKTG